MYNSILGTKLFLAKEFNLFLAKMSRNVLKSSIHSATINIVFQVRQTKGEDSETKKKRVSPA